jgi:hypothetical protein
MNGVLLLREIGGGSSGGSVSPASWTNIGPTAPGTGIGWNNVVTLTATGTASLTATPTGGGNLFYNLNGVIKPYSGPFAVTNGDTLSWGEQNTTGSTVSGSVTVTQGMTAIGSFSYIVRVAGP